jgi:hypothetical protein
VSPTLAALPGIASQFIAMAALLSGIVALAATRRPALALGILLDMLVAAGLLRLVGDPSWRALATAAIVIAIRHLVGYGLRIGARSWTAAPEGEGRTHSDVAGRLLRPAWRL